MSTAESGKIPTSDDLSPDERARFSLMGFMRFDPIAVGTALRGGTLSQLAIEQLARMIEGRHSLGLKLVMQGQGKSWKPIQEKAKAYDRMMAVGKFVDASLAAGCTNEESVIDAAATFGLSEPTVYRDLSIYRSLPEIG